MLVGMWPQGGILAKHIVPLSASAHSRCREIAPGPMRSPMEDKDDVDVVRVALTALMRRMTDDQINRVIGELEYVAEERGDRTGESAHAQAAEHLIAVLESRRERRNGHSVPPPSLGGVSAPSHDG
jgi:hypothetical protein